MSCINGSSISSTRWPQMTPVMRLRAGLSLSFGEEGLETGFLRDVTVQAFLGVARQPADDLVDFGLGAALLLGLCDIRRVHAGEAHGVHALPLRQALGGHVHQTVYLLYQAACPAASGTFALPWGKPSPSVRGESRGIQMKSKHTLAGAAVAALVAACQPASVVEEAKPAAVSGSPFLFVWSADKDKVENDFMSAVDLRQGSTTYGDVVATLPIGATGTMPHHVEYEFPEGGMLFADGFTGNLTSLIDLRDPLQPKLAAQIKEMGAYSFPHSYARLDNGNVLVTLQGTNGKYGAPGGLAELTPDGKVLRTVSAASPATPAELAWPYSLAVLPGKDRAVVTLAEMGWPGQPYKSTRQVQVWSPSDLKLLGTADLPESGQGEHHVDPAEARVLADGTVYVGTFSCGVYRLDGVIDGAPKATFVHAFPGGTEMHNSCAVPVVAGNYYVQTVPEINGLIALDVSDPMKPVEASRIVFAEAFHMAHWIAADRKSDRLVVTGNDMSWALIVKIEPATGAMKVDDSLPTGISFDRVSWPHGDSGPAKVHGALFGG